MCVCKVNYSCLPVIDDWNPTLTFNNWCSNQLVRWLNKPIVMCCNWELSILTCKFGRNIIQIVCLTSLVYKETVSVTPGTEGHGTFLSVKRPVFDINLARTCKCSRRHPRASPVAGHHNLGLELGQVACHRGIFFSTEEDDDIRESQWG